jgi:hypothetical protein
MAVLTLLDIAARTNSDPLVGLVEEILNVAPELRVLPVVPKSGTKYSITRRVGKPRGAFRNVNEGVDPGKSTYQQIDVSMAFFDGQMIVDDAIVQADDRQLGDILADEGAGQLQDTYVVLGDQIYRGTSADTKGFSGLKQQVAETMVVDATGTGAATETVWFVYADDRAGLHVPIGRGGSLTLGDWTKQSVTDAAGKRFSAHVNNLSFYMGLAFGSATCVGCVKNVTTAKPITDALGEQLFAKFAVGRKPTHVFMSRNARYLLQQSRVTTMNIMPPRPTELAGVPIVETDSIATLAAW